MLVVGYEWLPCRSFQHSVAPPWGALLTDCRSHPVDSWPAVRHPTGGGTNFREKTNGIRQDHPPDTGIMGQKIRINGTATAVTIMESGNPIRQ